MSQMQILNDISLSVFMSQICIRDILASNEISIHNPVLIHNNISLSQMQILNDISQIITITNN